MPQTEWMVLPLDQIEFGERTRTEYGDIAGLVESIKKDGEQLQPLVVKREGTAFRLICGGRRYMALKQLGWPAKCEVWPEDISEYQLRSMELRENLDRKQMDWREVLRAKEQLHNLEKTQNPSQSIEDTAALIGESRTLVAQDLELSKAISTKPEIFEEAKTKSDAKKILAREKEKILKKAILKKMEAIRSDGTKDFDNLIAMYRIGDCFVEMKRFPDHTFDFADVDPPYNIGNFDKIDGVPHFEDNIEDYEGFMRTLLVELFRVMKSECWMTLWFSITHYPMIRKVLDEVGFSYDPIPLVWIKEGQAGAMNHPQTRFKKAYETCLVVNKGNPALNSEAPNGIFTDRVISRIHPTEKPLKTLREIFKQMVQPGDLCLVPFAGSGNSIRVLHDMAAKPVGFDLNEAYKSDFASRVKGVIDATV